jgi:hypothetical protein
MPMRIDVLPTPDAREEAAPLPPGSNLPAVVARRRRANRIGWVAVALVVVVVVVGLVVGRHQIVGAWPAAARLYDTVGLPVGGLHAKDLRISGVVSERLVEGGVPILVVRGEISNTGEQSQSIPAIRAALKDEAGEELHHWTFTAEMRALGAGESTIFQDRLTSPPRGATNLSVDFVIDLGEES